MARDDLAMVLATLEVMRRPGRFVFVDGAGLPGALVLASIVEREGPSALVREVDARRLGLASDQVLAWLSVRATTDLGLVGLTASLSGALAARGIACNVIAGLRHDHLFVPVGSARRALECLGALAAGGARADSAPGQSQ